MTSEHRVAEAAFSRRLVSDVYMELRRALWTSTALKEVALAREDDGTYLPRAEEESLWCDCTKDWTFVLAQLQPEVGTLGKQCLKDIWEKVFDYRFSSTEERIVPAEGSTNLVGSQDTHQVTAGSAAVDTIVRAPEVSLSVADRRAIQEAARHMFQTDDILQFVKEDIESLERDGDLRYIRPATEWFEQEFGVGIIKILKDFQEKVKNDTRSKDTASV